MISGSDIDNVMDAATQGLTAAHTAVAQLQVAAGEVHQALATSGRISSQTVAALHVITMYGESVNVLLRQVESETGLQL